MFLRLLHIWKKNCENFFNIKLYCCWYSKLCNMVESNLLPDNIILIQSESNFFDMETSNLLLGILKRKLIYSVFSCYSDFNQLSHYINSYWLSHYSSFQTPSNVGTWPEWKRHLPCSNVHIKEYFLPFIALI